MAKKQPKFVQLDGKPLPYSHYRAAAERYILGEDIETLAECFQVDPISLKQRFANDKVEQLTLCKSKAKPKPKVELVTCLDQELSHRENIAWAMNAAGLYFRTKQIPISCPNNTAFYLYKQAVDNPKDFFSKVHAAEIKNPDDPDTVKRASAKSVQEIDEMLAELAKDVKGENDTV